jgi:hypothetical protein
MRKVPDPSYLTGDMDGNYPAPGLTPSICNGCVITVEATRRGEDRLPGRFDTSRTLAVWELPDSDRCRLT